MHWAKPSLVVFPTVSNNRLCFEKSKAIFISIRSNRCFMLFHAPKLDSLVDVKQISGQFAAAFSLIS